MKISSARSMLVMLAMALVFTGLSCARVGKDFPTDPVKTITIGQTTKADIRNLFGEPWRTGIENGQRTWTYGYYRYKLFGTTVTRDLLVRFDDRDRVASYTYSTSDYED